MNKISEICVNKECVYYDPSYTNRCGEWNGNLEIECIHFLNILPSVPESKWFNDDLFMIEV
jgi:hypothetical protein